MITIVSGLPRSGTSLMMQMLAAGGMPILSDGERRADVDNPKGYLEWERIKTLPKNPGYIACNALCRRLWHRRTRCYGDEGLSIRTRTVPLLRGPSRII